MKISVQIIINIVSLLFSITFWVNLTQFNGDVKELNPFEILSYDEGAAWKYLIGAIFITVVLVTLTYLFVFKSDWMSYVTNLTLAHVLLLIAVVVLIIANVAAIYFIVLAISNPILRSVVLISGLGVIFLNYEAS